MSAKAKQTAPTENAANGGALDISIEVEAGGWPPVDALEVLLNEAVAESLAEIGAPPAGPHELGVVFTDDAHIARLNSTWRGKSGPTNVLSFPIVQLKPGDAPPPLLGDIVLAYETVAREAVEQNKSFNAHLTHLVVHGFLHLVGHDHMNEDDAELMENTERRILKRLAISDPYA